MLNNRRVRDIDLSSIVSVGSGAAHLPPKVSKAFASILKNVDKVLEGTQLHKPSLSPANTPVQVTACQNV